MGQVLHVTVAVLTLRSEDNMNIETRLATKVEIVISKQLYNNQLLNIIDLNTQE